MAARAYKALVFDCYGVLVAGTRSLLKEDYPKVADALDELGRQSDHGYVTRSEYFAQIAELTRLSVPEVEAYLRPHIHHNMALLAYIVELKKTFKIGLLSNIGQDAFEHLFKEPELYFDEIVLSYRTGFIKPQPEIYYHMADKLGLMPQDCFFIDDIQENVVGAQNIGMGAIQYINLEQLKSDLQTHVAYLPQ